MAGPSTAGIYSHVLCIMFSDNLSALLPPRILDKQVPETAREVIGWERQSDENGTISQKNRLLTLPAVSRVHPG
jgi:hypothetical protein